MTKRPGFQNRIIVKKFIKLRANGFWYLLRCNECNKEFELPAYQFNNGIGNFCSKSCYGKSRSKLRKCFVCGKKWFSNHKSPEGKKYCSRKCMSVGYRNSGNPCWRGGISRLPYHHQFRDKLKQFIRERDNYTCFICKRSNLSSFNAHIHHLNGNKLDSNEFNLVTICRWCHGSISAKGIYNLKKW